MSITNMAMEILNSQWMSDFKKKMEENNMVYVTWADADDEEVNVVSFSTMEEAEEFVKENNLSDIADINAMDW